MGLIVITVRVDSRLRVPTAGLTDEVLNLLKAEVTHSNPAHYKAVSMGFYTKEPKTITLYRDDEDGYVSLPRGAANTLRAVAAIQGLELDFDDCRSEGTLPRIEGLTPTVELRDYQVPLVEAALRIENCLIRSPTGSGKTTCAIAFAARAGLPTLFLVNTGGLVDLWVKRIAKELGIDRRDIGILGGGKHKIMPITVAMQQTLYSNPRLVAECSRLFGTVVVDEVQLFAARTFVDVVDRLACRYRVGWSADERRKDKREFLIYDVFGKVAAEVKQADLIELQMVHDVVVKVVPTEFTADWFVAQDNEPGVNPDWSRLFEEMTSNTERTQIAANIAEAEAADGHQVLAFVHRREHVDNFERVYGRPIGKLLGGSKPNKVEFRRTVEGLTDRSINVAAGTFKACGVGIDLPAVDVGIVLTPIGTNKQFFGQVRGRLCRPSEGKAGAVLYYLWDKLVFGIEPLINLNRWNNQVQVLSETGEYVPAKQAIEGWSDTVRQARQAKYKELTAWGKR
jgi:superfamily II DNA or RNA helicase